MKDEIEFIDFKKYIRNKETIFDTLSNKARHSVDVLISHIRDDIPGNELERIANLCNDEAIKVLLLEFLDIARKQKTLITDKKEKNKC